MSNSADQKARGSHTKISNIMIYQQEGDKCRNIENVNRINKDNNDTKCPEACPFRTPDCTQ
jgi:hypothetical protein